MGAENQKTMANPIKKNYYELLDISPVSSRQEIEDAYKHARLTYGDDSAALYSLYSKEERAAILEQVIEAYETLRDPVKKKAYDRDMASLRIDETREVDINAFNIFHEAAQAPAETEKTGGPGSPCETVVLNHPPVVAEHRDPAVTEQYRMLYAKLEQLSHKKSHKTFAVTSALKGEGKSTTSLNLAYIMATEFNKKTLLIECDLRKPSTLLALMNGRPEGGLIEVLNGKMDFHSAVKKAEGSDLYLLPSGAGTKNMSELLGSVRLKNLINMLKTEFDYVILDSPPILTLADTDMISRLVDGVLVVVRAGKTPKDVVVKAINSLSSGNIEGIILNGADIKLRRYY